jgi:hypothetical protein
VKTRLGRATLALLVLVGVAAAVARASFPADLGARMDPYRTRMLRALALVDPNAGTRASEVARFDSPFAARPAVTLLHVVPGGLFLLLTPLQFSRRLRTRRPRVHRWCGRFLLLCALVSVVSGLDFGLRMPFAGTPEALAIGVFGGLFLLAIVRGFVAIRRHDPALHREWMIRAFAIALGISTVRLLGGVFDLALAPAGVGPGAIFVLSVWTGWLSTLGAAELWIRRSRPRLLAIPRGLEVSVTSVR